MTFVGTKLQNEQLNLLTRQLPIILIINVFMATLMTASIWNASQYKWILIWLLSSYFWTTTRFFLFRFLNHFPLKNPSPLLRMQTFAILSGISGIVWGASAFLLNPDSGYISHILVGVTLMGMVGGSMMSLGFYYPAILSFTIPALLPMIGVLFTRNDHAYFAIGGMMLVFQLFCLYTARNLNRTLITSLRLQHEKQSLLEEVEEKSEKLRELDIAKSQFFANITHEFRTPITLTLGPLQDLLDSEHEKLSSTAKNAIYLATKQSKRLLTLVNELLDIARLNEGKLTLNCQEIDLVKLTQFTSDSFVSLAKAKSIKLECQTDLNSALVIIDDEQIQKVISNLIGNAIKYTQKNGIVRVELKSTENHWLVSVEDNGPGINEQEVERIFDRFQRVAKSDHYQEGIGLGLALAKEIAELHNGKISVESSPGKGSKFILELPIVTHHTKVEKTTAPSTEEDDETELALTDNPAPEEKPSILVVEDNVELRRYITSHLEPDYHVLQTSNGIKGLNSALKHIPDLIISDIMMPEMDGISLCKALKNNTETAFIPILLLTALAEENNQIEGYNAEADSYMVKPFSAYLLKARIRNLLANRKKLLAKPETIDLFPIAEGLVSRDIRFKERFHQSINKGLSQSSLSVDFLANDLGVERSTLYRKTQAIFNDSPNNLITHARLSWAKELLQKEEGNVGDIAFTVGYASVAHFSHIFKSTFTCTPTQYRKSKQLPL